MIKFYSRNKQRLAQKKSDSKRRVEIGFKRKLRRMGVEILDPIPFFKDSTPHRMVFPIDKELAEFLKEIEVILR